MTAVYPGGAPNTYVPSLDATNQLTVHYCRRPESFPINRYVQIKPVTKSVGLYAKLGYDMAARVGATNSHRWADGDDAPEGRSNTDTHEFPGYQTKRDAFPFRIGGKSVKEAAWDILATHGKMNAQLAMTVRTQRIITLMTTGANWGGNTSAVSSISGVQGKWNLSTTARNDIKRSIDYASEQIHLATNGAIEPGGLHLVMSPGCARKISVCQEIVDFIKGSPDAREYIKGNLGPNAQYGLPEVLFGAKVEVENTVKVTSKKGATRAASYVLGDSTPFMCYREGDQVAAIDSNEAPTVSTCSVFMLREMEVWSKYDSDNEVHKGRIVEDYAEALTAPVSGFLFTAAVD